VGIHASSVELAAPVVRGGDRMERADKMLLRFWPKGILATDVRDFPLPASCLRGLRLRTSRRDVPPGGVSRAVLVPPGGVSKSDASAPKSPGEETSCSTAFRFSVGSARGVVGDGTPVTPSLLPSSSWLSTTSVAPVAWERGKAPGEPGGGGSTKVSPVTGFTHSRPQCPGSPHLKQKGSHLPSPASGDAEGGGGGGGGGGEGEVI
jgi:hypothetical protein